MYDLTAKQFVSKLQTYKSEIEKIKISKFFIGPDPTNQIMGIRMKHTFDLAKEFKSMPLSQVEILLVSPFYEARMGAVSIMDFKTRTSKITDEERKELCDLYLRNHDRINNWDLVDRSAPRVVGWYLLDRPKDILYSLATSENIWERRTAITATFWMIRAGQVDDALKISKILINDSEDLINKSVGTALREVGLQNLNKLTDFLDNYARTMPRVTLRYAIEKLEKDKKNYFLN